MLAKLDAANPRGSLPLSVIPNFKQERLDSASASFGREDFGEVLVQWDASQFGGAKEGFLIQELGITCRQYFGQPRAFALAQRPKVERRGTRLVVDGECAVSGRPESYQIELESSSTAIRLVEVIQLLQSDLILLTI